MLTNRCNFELSKYLKEHRFPQTSLQFDSDYYDELGKLIYNVGSEIEKGNLTFAPFLAEVLDRLEIDLGLYINVFYTPTGYQYRVYDPESDKEILSNFNNFDKSLPVYELGIKRAIEYYYENDNK